MNATNRYLSARLTPVSDEAFVLEDQVVHLLRRAQQRAGAIFSGHLGASGLTAPQFSALFKLYEEGAVSQNSLGRKIAMDAATMQGVVRRLIDRGLVLRTDDETDRRRVSLSLTEAGIALVSECTEAAQRASHEVLAPLNSREQQSLMRLLRRVG